MDKLLLTPKDVAALTGLSLPSVYNWFHIEGFPVIRIGRKMLVTTEGFNRWLEKQGGEE